MLCPNCESVNRDGAKFCDECGFPLTGAIAARAAELAAIDSKNEVHGKHADVASVPEPAPVVEPEPALEIEPETAVEASSDAEPAAEVGEEPITISMDPIEVENNVEGELPETHDDVLTGNVDDESAVSEPTEMIDMPEMRDSAGAVGPDMREADVTKALEVDFTGLEVMENEYGERLVDPGYQQPEANWRDGHTMQMPRIEGDEAPRSKDFLASATTEQKKSKKTVIGVILAIVVIAAIAVFATYHMQLWGGKAIPDVQGMTEADAASVLEDSGFSVRVMQVKSDDTEGLVLLTDPTAGSRADEGAEVVIHVASAREIPAIVGKSESEAKALLDEYGYENVTYSKEKSDEPEGTVLSVSPEQGTRAKSSIAVIVKVAEPYIVPDTSGMGVDEAAAAIQAAGLYYDINYVDTQDYADGSLIGTEPAAGTKVNHDTVVILDVARARGIQLTQLTRELITPGYELNIGGTSYIVSSLNSANYIGNDQVAFSATARPYIIFFGVYVEGDPQEVSGVVTWSADNHVVSIS